MFCMSVNEGEGSRLGFLSILRKIGPVAALILMLTALLLLIWIMRTTYASLVNYDSSLLWNGWLCRHSGISVLGCP